MAAVEWCGEFKAGAGNRPMASETESERSPAVKAAEATPKPEPEPTQADIADLDAFDLF